MILAPPQLAGHRRDRRQRSCLARPARRPEGRDAPLEEAERAASSNSTRQSRPRSPAPSPTIAPPPTRPAPPTGPMPRASPPSSAPSTKGPTMTIEARLAAARADAQRLRLQPEAAADPGAGRSASMPGLSRCRRQRCSSRRPRPTSSTRRADRDRAGDPARRADQMGPGASRGSIRTSTHAAQ